MARFATLCGERRGPGRRLRRKELHGRFVGPEARVNDFRTLPRRTRMDETPGVANTADARLVVSTDRTGGAGSGREAPLQASQGSKGGDARWPGQRRMLTIGPAGVYAMGRSGRRLKPSSRIFPAKRSGGAAIRRRAKWWRWRVDTTKPKCFFFLAQRSFLDDLVRYGAQAGMSGGSGRPWLPSALPPS